MLSQGSLGQPCTVAHQRVFAMQALSLWGSAEHSHVGKANKNICSSLAPLSLILSVTLLPPPQAQHNNDGVQQEKGGQLCAAGKQQEFVKKALAACHPLMNFSHMHTYVCITSEALSHAWR